MEVQGCYSQKTEERCKLMFSKTLCWIVTTLNLVKGILMLFVAYGNSERPLLNIGDAIESFLIEEDRYTRGMGLRSQAIQRKSGWWNANLQKFDTTRRRKFVAGSLCRPQVIMSLIYFNYNALYTSISLITEWDRFGKEQKGLRTSSPSQGHQRQTYFLQLPFRYSLPLTVFSGGLHWLISQSIFLVFIEVYDSAGNKDDDDTITSCGWSPVGVICVIVAGTIMVGLLVMSGFRRLRYGGIPVAGSCSAAISAACHPAPNEEPKLWIKALRWGVVSEPDSELPHCSFSSRKIDAPSEGKMYR
ncbi:hypothetical protein CLIM01_13602 [Colletotrichum limetticola]|uniref:Uncharacterized protein n=1 Tax=Colletotrichum limetticola TaxID=1209924 RepID=A0ABQ9PGJ5_9PEZI|nr:hypothetical protein CLIM01_13602 [Colletotrichum limetticola]